jgi:hypothetical protein
MFEIVVSTNSSFRETDPPLDSMSLGCCQLLIGCQVHIVIYLNLMSSSWPLKLRLDMRPGSFHNPAIVYLAQTKCVNS